MYLDKSGKLSKRGIEEGEGGGVSSIYHFGSYYGCVVVVDGGGYVVIMILLSYPCSVSFLRVSCWCFGVFRCV